MDVEAEARLSKILEAKTEAEALTPKKAGFVKTKPASALVCKLCLLGTTETNWFN